MSLQQEQLLVAAFSGEGIKMLKKFLRLIGYLTILAVMSVTAKADTTFSGKLSGAQMVPPNASTAVGVGTIILNDAETRINISLDFSGLGSNQTAAHIHGPAGPGSEAPVLFNLGSQGATSGTFTSLSAAVSRGQVAQLRAGKWYFDVHSSKLLHGEIRAQILPAGEAPANNVNAAGLRIYRSYSDEFGDELGCLVERYQLTLVTEPRAVATGYKRSTWSYRSFQPAKL